VRKKYSKFEGSLKGIDTRILTAQVPGGMLTNMESQLKEQGAEDKFDDVLKEIPRVREDLGFIPLVTPTSQIVGTQAVLNVLRGERYASISKETTGILKGEYGSSPAPLNSDLQVKVLDGGEPITCRPADLIEPEMDALVKELVQKAEEDGIELAAGENEIDDVLTYALFPQIGLKFLKNRGNPDAFEPVPTGKESSAVLSEAGEEIYTVEVDGSAYTVTVSDGGDISGIVPVNGASTAESAPSALGGGEAVASPLAGNIFKVLVRECQQEAEGECLIVLEAMKMETQVSASKAGVVTGIKVKEGDSVAVGATLLSLA
jgi:oxaloacetate decarboxylase alpha subunit